MEYPVSTLCGSTRFKDEFLQAQKDLTLQGYVFFRLVCLAIQVTMKYGKEWMQEDQIS